MSGRGRERPATSVGFDDADLNGGAALVLARNDRGLAESDGAGVTCSFTAEEIMTYGRHLGLDPVFEPDLLWIAEQALGAPLPANWKEHVTPAGDVYFANSLTGVTSWDHPLEDEFRALAESVRQRKRLRAAAQKKAVEGTAVTCLLYTSPSPRDATLSRMPSSA